MLPVRASLKVASWPSATLVWTVVMWTLGRSWAEARDGDSNKTVPSASSANPATIRCQNDFLKPHYSVLLRLVHF